MVTFPPDFHVAEKQRKAIDHALTRAINCMILGEVAGASAWFDMASKAAGRVCLMLANTAYEIRQSKAGAA